jgi:hypothetical protein
MTGILVGTLSTPGHQAGHTATSLTLREVIIGLIVIAVFAVLLYGPILAGALFDLFSKGVDRAAPGAFFTGLGVLFVGIISGVRDIEIAGAALIGAVVLGYIVENYLTWIRCNHARLGSQHRVARPRMPVLVGHGLPHTRGGGPPDQLILLGHGLRGTGSPDRPTS